MGPLESGGEVDIMPGTIRAVDFIVDSGLEGSQIVEVITEDGEVFSLPIVHAIFDRFISKAGELTLCLRGEVIESRTDGILETLKYTLYPEYRPRGSRS